MTTKEEKIACAVRKATATRVECVPTIRLPRLKLTTVPIDVLSLGAHLCVLDLSGNMIAEVPQYLSQLSNLSELYLYKNRISHVPTGILGSLTKLCSLSLADNPNLGSLPLDLAACGDLLHVDVSACNFAHIPAVLSMLGKLSSLNMVGNPALVGQACNITALGNQRAELQRRFREERVRGSFACLFEPSWQGKECAQPAWTNVRLTSLEGDASLALRSELLPPACALGLAVEQQRGHGSPLAHTSVAVDHVLPCVPAPTDPVPQDHGMTPDALFERSVAGLLHREQVAREEAARAAAAAAAAAEEEEAARVAEAARAQGATAVDGEGAADGHGREGAVIGVAVEAVPSAEVAVEPLGPAGLCAQEPVDDAALTPSELEPEPEPEPARWAQGWLYLLHYWSLGWVDVGVHDLGRFAAFAHCLGEPMLAEQVHTRAYGCAMHAVDQWKEARRHTDADVSHDFLPSKLLDETRYRLLRPTAATPASAATPSARAAPVLVVCPNDATADFALVFNDGTRIRVHSWLLAARLPAVVGIMLSGQWREACCKEMRVTESVGAWKWLLRWCYEGTVFDDDDDDGDDGDDGDAPAEEDAETETSTVIQLLLLASRLGAEEVRDECDVLLRSGVTLDNVAEVVAMAHQYNLSRLAKACVSYVQAYAGHMEATFRGRMSSCNYQMYQECVSVYSTA